MKSLSKLRELLYRGVELNDWILEKPCRIEEDLSEWNEIIEKVANHYDITIPQAHAEEIEILMKIYEEGIDAINEYMNKRTIVQNIKTSILEERLDSA